MNNTNSKLQAIRWSRPKLTILNQLELPHKTEYIEIADSTAGHYAITTMQTRGAPAIAIVAALSLAAEVSMMGPSDNGEMAMHINTRLDYLKTSRPTAVNLFDAIAKLKRVVREAQGSVAEAYVCAAEQMLEADIRDNKMIGEHGARFIQSLGTGKKVLTHCNTGALATAGHGTALGIVRTLKPPHVFYTETRPYNQGARLTGYELLVEQIPATLVCDSAVSALLQRDPTIVAIVVGADRVARNGDTANKIGTYQLAITAKYHNRAFVVAAPMTSIDLELSEGKGVVVEERSEEEITWAGGRRVVPEGTRAWNPSFDVTPACLISAIVTERGVFTKNEGEDVYDLATQVPQEN
ncbi:S-methyl-5-thioribose-1-phosphate isomerase [Coemansia spiralis]|uniref:Methylthioribose-1-phosphate isomerase n=2 Tax=Coemansia TaxID=4863 RepID=A0A9W8KW50_9FUNG|nr:S-methyl-5-thioribose-1-phosphate isomerase [Coemansia umbellata]KAJ2622654.1 S-methyl-5-thioribose-1-phosphate isomerase [Coemansia sp. RSA 1358]KAJ2671278.1 S-methyl-5-thioribose-1-phosphate isomerase [Coemansia spiralis]